MSLRTGEGSCVPSNQSHKSNSTSGATSQPGQRYELVDLRDIKFPEDGDVYCIHFYGHDGKRKWKTVGTDFKAAWAAVMTMRYFAQVAEFFRHQTPWVVGIEATQGAHYWARALRALGHEVRLVAPQFVKPYLKSQKNDANDAEAICEAVSRPNMQFVPSKSIQQQDLQALHRIRSRMIGSRTQLGNQIRGLLAEYGIVLPLHLSQVRAALPRLIEDDNPLLSGFGRQLLAAPYEELCALEQRINKLEEQVQQIHRSNPLCQKIAAVEGIGPVTATAVVAAIADG